MPRTPYAGRPIERTSFSSKRIAWPSCEARNTIWLPSVSVVPTSSSSLSMPMAMMPRDMTLEKSFSSVFFTVPLRGEEDVSSFFFEVTHGEHGPYCLARLQRYQVADVLALAGGADIRDLVHLEPVNAAAVGEDKNVCVGRGDEQMLDELLVARLHAGSARTAAALHAVGRDRRTLQIPGVADRHCDLLVRDQILELDLGGFVFNYRTALVPVLLLHFLEFLH